MDDLIAAVLKIIRHDVLAPHFRNFAAERHATEYIDFLSAVEAWEIQIIERAQALFEQVTNCPLVDDETKFAMSTLF